MKIYVIWIILFARFLTVCGQVNIAAGGVTSQTLDLDWAGYLWTSDKAVDGCDTAAISANFSSAYTASRCCSCSNGGAGQQTWTVKLTTPSVLSTIVIEGRTDIAIQLTGFTVEIQPVSGDPPIQIYDNAVTGDQVTRPIRIENLATKFPIVIERVNVKRPQGPLTLCEVKVFSGHIYCPIFMKLGQKIHPDDILDKFKNDAGWLKNMAARRVPGGPPSLKELVVLAKIWGPRVPGPPLVSRPEHVDGY
ncbi:hypothetical protein DPMN_083665 [Dreissena polymorpha]|uniref:Uncharacterized protein n=1 Tax=Dreissena polymorpha TaxID=45954 RepID=A0A9D3Y9Q7_DREPO|nr:hypothetical protein DPMN_083665 [Dreissena polymorpha]